MKKKIILTIVSFILSLFFVYTLLLVIGAKKYEKLTIDNINGENYIENITIGSTTYYLDQFVNKDSDYEYNEELGLLKFDNNDHFEIKVSNINSVYIDFLDEKSNGKVSIKYKNDNTEFLLNKDSDSQYYISSTQMGVVKNVINNSNTKIYVYILVFLVYFIISYFVINKIYGILTIIKDEKTVNFKQITFIFISYFLLTITAMLPLIEILNKRFALLIFAELLGIIIYFNEHLKKNFEVVLPLFLIILTVNMSVLMPPFHVPDEVTHVFKAYSITHPDKVVKENGKVYLELPDNISNYFDKYMFAIHDSNYKTSIKEYYIDALVFKDNNSKTRKHNFSNTYPTRNFTYIPSAIIIYIGEKLNLPFAFLPILGRLINAFIFIIIATISIRIIPIFKRMFFLILLFPINIQQITAVNQDSISLSITFLLVAYIFNLAFNKKEEITKFKYILLLVLSFLLGLCKEVYFALTLLVFLIPNKKFKSKKIAILLKSLPLILCLIACLSKFIQVGSGASSAIGDEITLSYMISHPVHIIKLYFNTLYMRGSADLLNLQLNMFGWSTVWYDYLPATILYTIYTVLMVFDNNEKSITKEHRIILGLTGWAIVGLIYTSDLIVFKTTSPQSTIVQQLQSRYFIPALLPIYASISNDYLKWNVKNMNKVTAVIVSILFFVSYYTIIKGFFL